MASDNKLVGIFEMGSRERLDYPLNFNPLLTAESDTAASLSVANEGPQTATLGNGVNGAPSPSIAAGIAYAWIVNGTIGDIYELSYALTTTGGRIHERSIKVTVVDK